VALSRCRFGPATNMSLPYEHFSLAIRCFRSQLIARAQMDDSRWISISVSCLGRTLVSGFCLG
jgi:hypothetical protein